MILSQILYLMTGLLFGTTLLAVGIAIGFWMARRSGSVNPVQEIAPSKFDPREFLSMVRTIAESTNHIATDISQYQARMHELVEMSRNLNGKDAAEIKPILDQILIANNQMQARLEAAEKKLEQQHSQLESYLTEARTDALTGLANRRAFDQGLDELYAQHLNAGQPLSLVLLDVDHFKKINDTYGHAVGDVVLKRVADHLATSAEDCYLVARYGGEEFGVLFTDTVEEATLYAESLRKTLAGDSIEAEGHTIRVTASAGVAQLRTGERIGDLVRHSDQALYRAKDQGRNQVAVYDELHDESRHSPDSGESELCNPPSVHETIRGIEEIEKRVQDHLNQMVHEESKR